MQWYNTSEKFPDGDKATYVFVRVPREPKVIWVCEWDMVGWLPKIYVSSFEVETNVILPGSIDFEGTLWAYIKRDE